MGFGFIEEVARRKANGGPGWAICKIERVNNGSLVEGGIARPLKSGPYKGRPTWRDCKHFDKVIVTDAEADAEEAAYVRRTGNCHRCMGVGNLLASSRSDGTTTYRPCPPCNGTGKAKLQSN